MKKLSFILLLFTLSANIYAMPDADSAFVAEIMKSYSRQKHRLERTVRHRVKEINDNDTLYLIPTILFKRHLNYNPVDIGHRDIIATWGSFDTSTFYIKEFLTFNTSGDVSFYDFDNIVINRFLNYSTIYQNLISELIKSLNPDFVFKIAGLLDYFFILDNKIYCYKYNAGQKKMICHEDCIEYMKAYFNTYHFLGPEYRLMNQRKIIH